MPEPMAGFTVLSPFQFVLRASWFHGDSDDVQPFTSFEKYRLLMWQGAQCSFRRHIKPHRLANLCFIHVNESWYWRILFPIDSVTCFIRINKSLSFYKWRASHVILPGWKWIRARVIGRRTSPLGRTETFSARENATTIFFWGTY